MVQEQTSPVVTYYVTMLKALLEDADDLGNSQPLNKMTSMIMKDTQRSTLSRIDDLSGFLEELRKNVAQISTEVL